MMMISKKAALTTTLLAAAIGASLPTLASALQADAPVASAADAVVEIDPAILAQSVRSEVARIGTTGTVEDFEGSILFVVSQQNYATDNIRTALTTVLVEPATTENAKTAIRNILLQLARRKFNRGTGAIGSGGGSFGTSSFSVPIVGGGGGGSSYAN